jgi:amino acid adenylation domain-containing protein
MSTREQKTNSSSRSSNSSAGREKSATITYCGQAVDGKLARSFCKDASSSLFQMESNSRSVATTMSQFKAASPFKTFDPHLLMPVNVENPKSRRSTLTSVNLHSALQSYGKGSLEEKKTSNASSKRLNHVFEEQVRRLPEDAVAVVSLNVEYTYTALNNMANIIAASLRSAGVIPGSVVGILLNRGVSVYAAMLGVHKAACSYVPIDRGFPDSRIRFTLDNSGAAALLTSKVALNSLVKGTVQSNIPKIIIGTPIASSGTFDPETLQIIGPMADMSLANRTIDRDLAYIIYTSGTTGTPKGVLLTQENAVHYVENCLRPTFQLTAKDRVFQGYSTAFDAGFGEIWMAFSSGATLVSSTSDMMKSGSDLKDIIRELNITVLDTTPTNLLIMGDGQNLPNLRIVIVGGEQCSSIAVEKWQPTRKMYNMYGPTETTVSATIAELKAGTPVTIGQALPGYTLSVHDEILHPVEDGKEGELCISGIGVAKGYLNLPKKTKSKFIHMKGVRLYRTGDLVKRDSNGNITFLGRADSQVKIRGYRVELEEIESHLSRMKGVKSCVAAVQLNKTSEAQELIAFIVESSLDSFHVSDCRVQLQKDLPYYCIPMVFCIIDASIIEVSPISGKVLRKNLPHWSTQKVAKDINHLNSNNSNIDRSTLNPVEMILFDLFKDILGIQLNLDENVFNNGFNSVSGARLISSCRSKHLWHFIKMKDVYDHQTIRSLALFINEKLYEDKNDNANEKLLYEGFAVGASCSVVPNLLNQNGTEIVPSSSVSFSNENTRLPWELVPRYWTCFCLQMVTFIWFAFVGNILLTILSDLSNLLPPWAFALSFVASPIVITLLGFIQAVLVKHFIIGRFEESDIPIWSIQYFRWWLAQRLTMNPLFISGSAVGVITSRMLGATIGSNVYLGITTMPVEYDLITIESGATLQTGVAIQTWLVENRVLKLRKVHIGKNSYIGENSVIGMSGEMGEGTIIAPLSILPRGRKTERNSIWYGSPGRSISIEKLKLDKDRDDLRLLHHTVIKHQRNPIKGWSGEGCNKGFFVQLWLTFLIFMLYTIVGLCYLAPIGAVYLLYPAEGFADCLNNGDAVCLFPWVAPIACSQVILTLFVLIFFKRCIGGRTKSGSVRLNSCAFAHQKISALSVKLFFSGITRGFAETVFTRYVLVYGFGLNIGVGSEIDTSEWPAPDMVHVGKEAMINGGAVLSVPVVMSGRMTLKKTSLGDRCFLGNMTVVPSGSKLGNGTLLGVMSICPKDMEENSTWLGSPAFSLKNRTKWKNKSTGNSSSSKDDSISIWNDNITINKNSLLNSTSGTRKLNNDTELHTHLLSGIAKTEMNNENDLTFNPPCHVWMQRIFMNLIKVFIGPIFLLAVTTLFIKFYDVAGTIVSNDNITITVKSDVITMDWSWNKLFAWSVVSLFYPLVIIFAAILSKWLLVCCYRVQKVPMFSCFIWRSDLAYEIELIMRTTSRIFDGTPVIVFIYSALGVKFGKNVFVLGTNFMEHDLITVGANATLTGATLQTHLYEDRMYKTGKVVLGEGALVAPGGFALYGSSIGKEASLAPHSLLMRGEHFEPMKRHYGLPSGAAEIVSFETEEKKRFEQLQNYDSKSNSKYNSGERKINDDSTGIEESIVLRREQLETRRRQLVEAQLALSRAKLRFYEATEGVV